MVTKLTANVDTCHPMVILCVNQLQNYDRRHTFQNGQVVLPLTQLVKDLVAELKPCTTSLERIEVLRVPSLYSTARFLELAKTFRQIKRLSFLFL